MVPLWMYLLVAAGLFSIGMYGVLARRNAIAILMGIELMLNAVNINLVAFWRYKTPEALSGQVFAVFVFVARRYAGDDRYSNIRLSLYNGLFLTFFIVIILNFLKVVAGRFFPNSAPGQLILAA